MWAIPQEGIRTMINEQELNRKLAKWAGLKSEIHVESEHKWERFRAPDGSYHPLLDFTQSLDACFKWLVPKLQDKGHNINLLAFEHEGFKADISDCVFTQTAMSGYDPYRSTIGIGEDKVAALALCLAIEKVIDSEIPK